MLETLSGNKLGVLSNVSNLRINVKFSEPSEISFDLPAYSEGQNTLFYDDVIGYRVIRTDVFGVFIVYNPTITGDGIEEVKNVTGFSIEKTLESKRFFLEEGTFNFWNPTQSKQGDTVLGRFLEIAVGWKPGYVSPALIGRYRTFDQFDEDALQFAYNTASDKFRCVFVFDPYKMEVNVYDVDEERNPLPIYLDFDNLVTHLEVSELTD